MKKTIRVFVFFGLVFLFYSVAFSCDAGILLGIAKKQQLAEILQTILFMLFCCGVVYFWKHFSEKKHSDERKIDNDGK